MRRRLLITVLVLALVVVFAGTAMAVQFGGPDTDPVMYDGVGILIGYPGTGPYVGLCTVTLVDQDTALTAGHCTAGLDGPGAWTVVAFGQGYDTLGQAIADSVPGTPHPHPLYDDFASFPATYDVGVIEFDTPVVGHSIWPIADANTLDALVNRRGQQNTIFQITGYGVQDMLPPEYQGDLERYRGEVKLNNLNNANNDGYNIQVSANPGMPHSGGLCFGDSGGPVLWDGEIVAVNSFVMNGHCMGNGWSFRVDRPDVQAWLSTYVDGLGG